MFLRKMILLASSRSIPRVAMIAKEKNKERIKKGADAYEIVPK